MLAFSQPVFDMQRVFRVVLDAMSRPARLCRLPVFPQSVPDGLSPVLAALALTRRRISALAFSGPAEG